MKLGFSPQEEVFRMEFRTWLENNLPAGWLEGNRHLPEEDTKKKAFLKDWQRKLYDGGWAGIHWPKAFGGRGATLIEEVIYQEEVSRVKAPPVLNFMGINMVGPTLMQLGTKEQKERYIDKILSGEEIWCQGFSEPNAGSDLAKLQTSAVKRDGKWYITGQKVWTTYAHMADKCFILVRTENTGKKHEGITAFLIDMHQPGVVVRPIYQINEDHDFNEIFLTEVEVTDEDIVGGLGNGWKVSMALLGHERVGVAGTIFYLDHAFNDLIEDAKTFKIGGKPVIENDHTRLTLAKLYVRKRASKLNYYRNITKQIQTGYPAMEGSLDKLVTSELLKSVDGFAVSMLGQVGTLWRKDSPTSSNWQRHYLQSFGATIAGGTTEILKNVIGERILGLPKDLKK